MMANTSSWFKMQRFDKTASPEILFGPCLQNEVHNYLYPKEKVPCGTTVIWNPKLHKSITLESYARAHVENDNEVLAKISSLGIPLGCTFGGCISLK